MYKYTLHKRAEKYLMKQDKKVLKKVFDKLKILCQNPSTPLLDIKKLKGYSENYYRLRIGKYRLIYEVKDFELHIYVLDADTRGDVY